MRFRFSGAALAAAAAFLLASAPARAADNYPVRDGTGVQQSFCSKQASLIQWPCHLLGAVFGGVPSLLNGGPQLKASSLPVVLPTDPDVRSSTSNIPAADVATATVAGQSGVTLVTGAPTANSSIVWSVNGASSATIAVSGTFSLSANLEESADGGATYGPATAKILGTGATSGQVTGPGVFRLDATGMTNIRLRATSFTSGTLTAQLVASSSPGLSQILNPVRLSDSVGGVTGVTGNPLYAKSNDGDFSTIGAQADAAWSGTGNGTLVAIDKAIRNLLAGSLTVNLPTGASTAANQSTELTSLSQLHTDMIAPTPAGTNVIGKVGTDHTTPGTTDNVTASSIQGSIVVTPTVTASSAYASGNTLGGLQTLTGAVRISGGTALLQKVVIDFKSAQTAPTDVLIFSQSPGSTTVTDKTAVAVATADFDKLVGVVHITDCTSAGTATICQASGLALSLKAVGSANLFAVLVTRGAPTFTATSDVSANFLFIQD